MILENTGNDLRNRWLAVMVRATPIKEYFFKNSLHVKVHRYSLRKIDFPTDVKEFK